MNQDFVCQEFLKLVCKKDYRNYFSTKTLDEKKNLLKNVEDNFYNSDPYIFTTLKEIVIKGKRAYTLKKIKKNEPEFQSKISDDFILRKVNDNLCRVYTIQQADRYKIIKVICNILTANRPCYILKTDIKDFYESIKPNDILKIVNSSSLLSFDTKFALKQFFENKIIQKSNGLPRGINISASLSELFMKKFDNKVKKNDSIFFYARYVDDIIIFSTKKIEPDIIQQFLKTSQSLATETNLNLNNDKTECFEILPNFDNTFEFDFLGYHFRSENINKASTLKISISEKKVNKIKLKIIKSLIDYNKTKDFKLLKNRIIFLKANYPIKRPSQKISSNERQGCLHGGLAYSYSLINSFDELKLLDEFFYYVLYSTKFKRLNENLSGNQKYKLTKIKFYQGYHRRIIRYFSLDYLDKITRCWRN